MDRTYAIAQRLPVENLPGCSGLAKHIPYLFTRTLPATRQIWNMFRQRVPQLNPIIGLSATALAQVLGEPPPKTIPSRQWDTDGGVDIDGGP